MIARLQRNIPWRAGARELLAGAERRRCAVPCALVTMKWRRVVDPVLAAPPLTSGQVPPASGGTGSRDSVSRAAATSCA